MKKSYNHTREIEKISLNKIKDADIIEHLKDKVVSTYVKKLIREDMKSQSFEGD